MISKKSLLIIVGALALMVPLVVEAQGYQLLAPINSFTSVPTNDFAGYAQTIITLIIGVSAVLAVIMIMVGGLMWIGGEAVRTKSQGISFIKHAVGGLVLLLASYLILNTINPQLLNLSLNLPQLATNQTPTTPGQTTGGTTPPTSHYCFSTFTTVTTGTGAQDVTSRQDCFQSPTTCANAQDGIANSTTCYDTNAPAGSPAAPPPVVSGSGGLTQAVAAQELSNFGICSTQGGCGASACTDATNPHCTSFSGIQQETVNALEMIKADCKCDMTITGGTEIGHDTNGILDNGVSHSAGYAVDLGSTPQVDSYFQGLISGTTGQLQKNGTTLYVVSSDTVPGEKLEVIDERTLGGAPHWHVGVQPNPTPSP